MPFQSEKQRKWMHQHLPDIAKKWEQKYPHGGAIHGPDHDEGGVPIEAEGGEYIIKKDSVNENTLPALEYINETGELPIFDARDRGEEDA